MSTINLTGCWYAKEHEDAGLNKYIHIRLTSLHNNTKWMTKVETHSYRFNMTQFSSHRDNFSMSNFDL